MKNIGFAWHEVMAITAMGFGRICAHSLFPIFVDLRRQWGVWRGLYQFSDPQLKLDLPKDSFTECPAVQHEEFANEDLMGLEAQRKDEERQEEEEVTEKLKIHMTQETARGCSVSEEALLVFEAWDLNTEQYGKVAGAVHKLQSSAIMSSMMRKKSYSPDITGLFIQEGSSVSCSVVSDSLQPHGL